jgi:hypothetical protein
MSSTKGADGNLGQQQIQRKFAAGQSCVAMALALAEEIAVLKNRIALYESDSEAAKVNGNEARQRLLLATSTATRNNLLHLEKRLEKQGNRNQSAMSRGIKGTPFSSKLLEQRNKFNS